MLYDRAKKDADILINLWFGDFFTHHKLDSVGVSRTVTDQFLNPVGHIIKNAVIYLYSAVIGEDVKEEEVRKHIEGLMRIQAVQELTPARALAPLLSLKEHLYKHFEKEVTKACDEYKKMSERVDTILLMAFDIYAQDKEILYRVRVNELKSAQSQILRFAQSKGYEKSE